MAPHKRPAKPLLPRRPDVTPPYVGRRGRTRSTHTRLLFVALLSAGAPIACGPIQSSSLLVDASADLSAARTAEAERLAPFEYVAAEEYLHKAREEQSYANFEIAVEFAKKSRDCALVALVRAEAKTSKSLGAKRPTRRTGATCRPGPDRNASIPAADQEPAAGNKSSPERRSSSTDKDGPNSGDDSVTPPAGSGPEAAPSEPGVSDPVPNESAPAEPGDGDSTGREKQPAAGQPAETP